MAEAREAMARHDAAVREAQKGGRGKKRNILSTVTWGPGEGFAR